MREPDSTRSKNTNASALAVGAKAGSARKSRGISDRLITGILVAAMVLGIALLAYPSFSDYWNSFHQSRAVLTYA